MVADPRFLFLNGVRVPVAIETARRTSQFTGEDARSDGENQPIVGRSVIVFGWEAETSPVLPEDAEGFEGLIAGFGHRFPFTETLFSTRGRGPLTLSGASIVAGGFFGGDCAEITTLVYDFSKGPIALLDRWFVMVFREEAGTFRLYGVRSDGAVFRDGVRDDALVTSDFLTVFDGFITLSGAPTKFSEFVPLFFCPSDSQCLAMMERMRLELIPFSNLPDLDAEGDMFGGRRVTVIGELEEQRIVEFGGRTTLADGATYWRNNGREIPFKLWAKRARPTLLVPHPEAFFSLDTGYFGPPPVDLSLPRDTITATGAVTQQLAGQVEEGGILDANTDGWSFASSLERGDTDELTVAAGVMVSSAAPVGTPAAVVAKINVGTSAGWWLFVTPKVNGYVDVDLHIRNSGATNGRRVTASDAFKIGERHHIVGVYDGRGDTTGMRLIIDGARAGASAQNTDPGSTTNGLAVRVGRAEGTANSLVGEIDEPGVWTVALSDAEAYELFRTQSHREQAQWRWDEYAAPVPPSMVEVDHLARSRPWSGVGVQTDDKSRVWVAEATDSGTNTRLQRVTCVPPSSFTAFADQTMMCSNPGVSRAGSADAFGVFSCIEGDDLSTVYAGTTATGGLRSIAFFGTSDGVRDGTVTTLGGFSGAYSNSYETPRQAPGGGYVGGCYLITGATGFSSITKKDSSCEQIFSPSATSWDISSVQMDTYVDVVAHAYNDGADKVYLELIEGTTVTAMTTLTTIAITARSVALEKVTTTDAIVYIGGSNGTVRAYSFTTTPGAATLLWTATLSGGAAAVVRCRLIPGTDYLVVCATKRIYLLNKNTGAEVLAPVVVSGADPLIYDIAFNDDDEYFYAVGIEDLAGAAGRLWKIEALGIFP